MSSNAILAFTTTNNEKVAYKLAQALVIEKLAACVQVIPKIRSFYEWDGQIHADREQLLIIKGPKAKVNNLKTFIAQHHSYEVPELVILDITDALPKYLQWLLRKP